MAEQFKSHHQYGFEGYYIPERMLAGLQRYVSHGIEPGSFLYAVLCNDLKAAVACADNENMANLPAYASWLYNEAPSSCQGSREKVKAWLESFASARSAALASTESAA